MNGKASILLVQPVRDATIPDIGLPKDDDNIFQRIIRNPHIESANPRERECTEMLCSVLRNAGSLRLRLLRWLGRIAGSCPGDLEQLECMIDTEQPIGPKRDDLRIEGWRNEPEGQRLVLLWTVEVKVAAPLHESSPLELNDIPIQPTANAELVNQLANYDRWLSNQAVDHKAGFVLAMRDLANEIPSRLQSSWRCLSWTHLGSELESALKETTLPCHEEMLAKHLLGFIRKHLWSAEEMSSNRIEFDDIALMRAYIQIGWECEKKVNRIVSQLIPVLENSGVGHGAVKPQQTIFKSYARSAVCRPLFDPNLSSYPVVMAGIERASVAVWLETPPTCPGQTKIVAAISARLEALQEQNALWTTEIGESPMYTWPNLKICTPLENMLAAEDQEEAVKVFVSNALEDLKKAGVITSIEQCLKGTR